MWSLAHSEGEGRLLCSGSADCTVKIWQNPAFGELRAEQGVRRRACRFVFAGHARFDTIR